MREPQQRLRVGIPGEISRGRGAGTEAQTRKRWLASAGTVSAVFAVLAVIAGAPGAGQADSTHQQVTLAVAMVQRGIPRYYVALDSKGPVSGFPEPLAEATVRVTATGSVIARISAPRPYVGFTAVTGAADDRTFVLLAHARTDPFNGEIPERFFVLRINPDAPSATARARLTALPVRDIPGGQNAGTLMLGEEVATVALSPDGSSLAAILTVGGLNYLYVYNLATGKTRNWVWQPCGGCDPIALTNPLSLNPGIPALSWTADSRSVAFTFMYNHPLSTQLRLLHPDGQGNDVVASSTPFLFRAPVSFWRQAVMTPDGNTVLMALTLPTGAGWFRVTRISTATSQAVTINTLPITDIDTAGYTGYGPLIADTILWTNNNGSAVIIADARRGHTLGVYSGDRYTPLPWPARAVDAAW